MIRYFGYTLFFIFALSSVVLGNDSSGKKLFNSTELGSNGKSCQTCHAHGGKLDHIDQYMPITLRGIINICIHDALKGKPLPEEDAKLYDLEKYIRQFKHQK